MATLRRMERLSLTQSLSSVDDDDLASRTFGNKACWFNFVTGDTNALDTWDKIQQVIKWRDDKRRENMLLFLFCFFLSVGLRRGGDFSPNKYDNT
mmetsp:Transcript_3045/g.4672  ORF Transcript_3045/g.4672 Transcript_3045/m.4672 type:complete len:95 (-) Transcript_3045:51-335(-)